jgi:hypothetical protein
LRSGPTSAVTAQVSFSDHVLRTKALLLIRFLNP